MAPSADDRPARACPACGQLEPIADAAPALWPAPWRCATCRHAVEAPDGIVRLAPALDGAIDGFDPADFARLAASEAGHFWFQARAALLAWLVERFARAATRVLEIGCGTGFMLDRLRRALPGARLAGSELQSAGLRFARDRLGERVELIQMDARRIGLRA